MSGLPPLTECRLYDLSPILPTAPYGTARIAPGTATMSVFDHGFLCGDGIYETMRTYYRRRFLFDRHPRRLRSSARMIGLELPFTDAELVSQTGDTIAAADFKKEKAYIRLLVTRGVGDLTYDPAATPTPSVVIIVGPQVDPPPRGYDEGVAVVITAVVRNHPDTVNPMIKNNNLMKSALAAQEAIRRGGFEGIMRNYRGDLSECTTSNLFIVKGGAALTPPLDAGLLPGIACEFLFDIGKDIGASVREQSMRDDDLFGADEAFLTSTTRELVPIVKVDDRRIGNGKPGAITKKLLDGFRKRALAD